MSGSLTRLCRDELQDASMQVVVDHTAVAVKARIVRVENMMILKIILRTHFFTQAKLLFNNDKGLLSSCAIQLWQKCFLKRLVLSSCHSPS
jgi:hypothetical protein